jgi:hypothetical protein
MKLKKMGLKIASLNKTMDSIFVLNKTNFEFFKNPVENCIPAWIIYGRVCYHPCESEYVFHNNVIHKDKHLYDGYLHVEPMKRPMYAISHYTVGQLKEMANRLLIPQGTKTEMYTLIRVIMDEVYVKNKKN